MNKFLSFLMFMLSSNHGQLGDGLEQYMNLPDETGQADSEGNESDPQDVDGQAPEQPNSDDEQPQDLKDEADGDLATQLENFEIEQGEKGDETAQGDLVEMVNSLGPIHDGLPFEVKDQDHLKELLQKGYDYTRKTQSFAEERKSETEAFEKEREQFNAQVSELENQKQEFEQTLNEYELFRLTLGQLQSEDPETFDYLQQLFDKQASVYNAPTSHPAFVKMQNKLSEFESKFAKQKESEQNEKFDEIRQSWEDGLKETQSKLGAKLRALKVPANWGKVQQIWQRDQSGEMSVEQALYAAHGKEITEALNRQKQLATTKAQSAARQGPPARETVSRDEQTKSKINDGYLDHLFSLADKHS